jgi:hypothetical protein
VTEPNLSAVYTNARGFSRVSGILKLVVAVFFGGLAFAIGAGLYLFVANALPGAIIFWLAGVVVAAPYGWRGYRDLTGEPVVLQGIIVRKEFYTSTGSSPGSRTVKHFLHMDVTHAFAVTAAGTRRPLVSRTGPRKVLAQGRVFDAVAESEAVAIICTPTGEAAARLDELA